MPEQFLHGIEVVEIDDGLRPIRTVKSSVIGLIGTAPLANATKFPLDTPVLIAGRRTEAASLGATGTLPQAIDGIFDQCGAMVVVIRVAEGTTPADTITNIVGGVDPDGKRKGVHAFLSAKSVVKAQPRILIAPGYSQQQAVASELLGIAEALKAVIIADGPNTTDADAITYREKFGSSRIYIVDPWVKYWDTTNSAPAEQPPSARIAGILSKIDNTRGFWWSPSNNEINGIVGTTRPVEFAMGDVNCRANFLNENEVATIIQEDGYRLWGNRSCASDQKWAFLCVRRTADMIEESILLAHLWAVDRCLSKLYVESVCESVNAYLRHLTKVGAILGGKCWVDPELNTPDQIADGKIYFDFDFTPPYPAEHITFRAHLVDDYLAEIFN